MLTSTKHLLIDLMIRLIALIIAIAIIIGMIAFGIYLNHYLNSKESREENKIIKYLSENTEDTGDYVISVQKAKSNRKDCAYYYAFMIDADGDFEMSVVEVRDGGKMEIYEVDWS